MLLQTAHLLRNVSGPAVPELKLVGDIHRDLISLLREEDSTSGSFWRKTFFPNIIANKQLPQGERVQLQKIDSLIRTTSGDVDEIFSQRMVEIVFPAFVEHLVKIALERPGLSAFDESLRRLQKKVFDISSRKQGWVDLFTAVDNALHLDALEAQETRAALLSFNSAIAENKNLIVIEEAMKSLRLANRVERSLQAMGVSGVKVRIDRSFLGHASHNESHNENLLPEQKGWDDLLLKNGTSFLTE